MIEEQIDPLYHSLITDENVKKVIALNGEFNAYYDPELEFDGFDPLLLACFCQLRTEVKKI